MKAETTQVRASTPEPLILVALGANLGQPAASIREALERLKSFAQSHFRHSSLWRSTPVDCPPGSPGFVNAAAAFVSPSTESPESLLVKLQELEMEFGRRPKLIPNEPRPLDLDLIAFGDETRVSTELVLPHPRAHLRRFVLEPLNEIAPDFTLPGQRQPIAQVLAELNTTEVVTRID